MDFPKLTKEQKKRIMNWLAETLFFTVMRKGGYPGLCCQQYDRQPTHTFKTFKEYKTWALGVIMKYKTYIESFVTKKDELYILDYDAMMSSESEDKEIGFHVDTMNDLFPFMDSDKDCPWDDKCDAIHELSSIL